MKKILVITLAVLMLISLSIPAFAADGDNLATTATVSAPFCSSWESSAALNDAVVPSASDEATAGAEGAARYGSWGSAYSNYETISYSWEEAVTVDSVGIFFGYNVTREDFVTSGGLHIPASYTVQYWNGTEFVDVTNGNGYGVSPDVLNVTTFDAVTTYAIQITFCKLTETECASESLAAEVANIQAWYDTEYPDEGLVATVDDALAYRGLGIYEVEVYEASAEEEEPDQSQPEENEPEENEPEENEPKEDADKAPQTGVAAVALAVIALISGAYIVFEKH